MIAELGHLALVLAFVLALVQAILPMIGASRRDPFLMSTGSTAAIGQFVFISLAFAALIHGYVVSDFSIENVFLNSHSTKPLLYKISGAWGNHEGSLVLWVLILALFGAAVAVFGRNLPTPFKARTLAVQGIIGLGFLAFMLLTSNPFIRLDPAPLDGRGLNPILQDPGLAMHPPMLYLGYVGFSTTFSFAMAALIEGRVDATWARWARPWTLAAWISLTFGIALGSWWAYYELGWGGWWFWDPVENASFMPWLAGTALLHSAIVVEKRETLKSWTILLAILTFSLSLLGTFLVRSGVLTSVHAFATDPARGVFILALLVVAIGGSLALYSWRAPSMQGGGLFAPISRESALLLNNLLLATATATVLLGTLYPLFLDALAGPKISVGPPFFNATFVPLMVPLLVAVPIGSMLAWKRGDLRGVVARLSAAGLAAVLVAVLCSLYVDWTGTAAALGFALAAWLVAGSLNDLAFRIGLFRIGFARSLERLAGLPGSAWGVIVAHAGLGILVAGITASSAGQSERILTMKAGDETDIAGYTVRFEGVTNADGPNYEARRGTFVASLDGEVVARLHSEKRFFPVEGRPTTEAGIDTTLWRDLYFVLGDEAGPGLFTVRLYHNPLVIWIWGGTVIMGLGGFCSLVDRRFRIGVPRMAQSHAVAAGVRA
ncbi:MAG: heme lyase CcmF/NrfE family subunit [Geminicoccaceae bacterium]